MLNFNFLTMIYYLQIDLLLFVQGQLNNVRKLMAFEVTSCKCFFLSIKIGMWCLENHEKLHLKLKYGAHL